MTPLLTRVASLFVTPVVEPATALPAGPAWPSEAVPPTSSAPRAPVAPAPPAPTPAVPPASAASPPASRLGLLAPPALLQPAALAAAHVLLRTSGAGAVLVALWGIEPRGGPRLPAARAAQRLALLVGGDPRGRAVVVAMGETEDASAAQSLGELCAAATSVPIVVGLAGARGPALDGLLATLDGTLVVTSPDSLVLAAAVLAGLERAGLPAASRSFAFPPIARAFACAGCAPNGPTRRALSTALAELHLVPAAVSGTSVGL